MVKSTTRATYTYRVNGGTYVPFVEALPISIPQIRIPHSRTLTVYLCNTSLCAPTCLSPFSRSLLFAPVYLLLRNPSMNLRLRMFGDLDSARRALILVRSNLLGTISKRKTEKEIDFFCIQFQEKYSE